AIKINATKQFLNVYLNNLMTDNLGKLPQSAGFQNSQFVIAYEQLRVFWYRDHLIRSELKAGMYVFKVRSHDGKQSASTVSFAGDAYRNLAVLYIRLYKCHILFEPQYY